MTQTTLRNGGVVDAVVPCGLGGNSLATWARDFNFELDGQQFFAIEGSCRREISKSPKELFRQELDNVLVGPGPRSIPQ